MSKEAALWGLCHEEGLWFDSHFSNSPFGPLWGLGMCFKEIVVNGEMIMDVETSSQAVFLCTMAPVWGI